MADQEEEREDGAMAMSVSDPVEDSAEPEPLTPVAKITNEQKEARWQAEERRRFDVMKLPFTVIDEAIAEIEPLTMDNVPRLSDSATKDRVLLQESYTTLGLMNLKISLTKHIATDAALLLALQGALERVKDHRDTAREIAYKTYQYEQELIALKVIRKEEAKAYLDAAREYKDHKSSTVRGRPARDERRQEIKKRKYNSINDVKEKGAYNL